MDQESARVFLPSREQCFKRLRLARFGETVMCVHCESEEVVKRGTTEEDAQQYWCKDCETYFNDLTNTIFGQHRFDLEEMFYIVKEMRSETTAQTVRELNRDYEAVFDFVHEVQDLSGEIDEFDLHDVCKADEVYVTAGEKGIEDEDGSPRSRGLEKRRGTFESDKPPVLALVRQDDGQVQFGVRKNLVDADEDIAEYGDGSVILYTDNYTIYDGIDEYGTKVVTDFLGQASQYTTEHGIDICTIIRLIMNYVTEFIRRPSATDPLKMLPRGNREWTPTPDPRQSLNDASTTHCKPFESTLARDV